MAAATPAERRRLLVLLPARRRWAWQDRLAARLAESHDVTVTVVESQGYPLALRLRLRTAATSPRPPPEGGFDLVLDLSEQDVARAGKVLRPHYDGSPDTLALIARLQRGQCPLLEIVEAGSGDIRASSYAAIGDSGRLDRQLQMAFARLEALLLRACANQSARLAERPERTAAAFSLPLLLKSAIRQMLGRLLAPMRRSTVRRHWNLALRRGAGSPILDRFDIGDYTPLPVDPGTFYADPFLIECQGEHFLFAEACPYATGKGVIVCAQVPVDGAPGVWRTVLERPWHLSYPFVFERDGEAWLLPESSAHGGVELYRATDFPYGWAVEARLFEELALVDATLFEHDGRLWLFAGVGTPGGSDWDELFAWHAPGMGGPWEPHAQNPIKSDCRSARPGGRPLRLGDRLLRPAQRCERAYGEALVWLEIRELTPEGFEEVEIAEWRAEGPGLSGPHAADLSTGLWAVDFRCLL